MSEVYEIVRVEAQKSTKLGDHLPGVGEWFWITFDPNEDDPDDPTELLMCVEHVASNHVSFSAESGRGTYNERLKFDELYTRARPEPNAKAVINRQMEETRKAMEAASRALFEEGVKRNVIAETATAVPADVSNPMLPAIRVMDPAKQKADLVALKEHLPIVQKKMNELAEEYAGHAKNLVLGERLQMKQVVKSLGILDDKIFTLEVYAGLQEEVLRIRDGEPAKPDEKITIRQSLLYMDEETLISYDEGGMDFKHIEQFDAWIARPENTDRCLPEPRGIVAFKVRRHDKDYGEITSIWEAWRNMEWKKWNMETYLLIRNGDRLYRICSEVSFAPRLIPYRNEFEGSFEKQHRNYNWETHLDEYTTETIDPSHFDYDDKVTDLKNRLKHYNRAIVLIQGLLDRSDVFHPHPPINLATNDDMDQWVNLVRDEEDVLGLTVKTWEEYVKECNEFVKAGDRVFVMREAVRKYRRGWRYRRCPDQVVVTRVRLGRMSDILERREEYDRSRRDHILRCAGRDAERTVGVIGVEVSYDCTQDNGWGKKEEKIVSEWFPMTEVMNMSAYQKGDYKQFLCDRHQKGRYLEWAPILLAAEDRLK